jgi:hypothetical protein
MKQPGVTVQPLRQMNGHASFNQVFFTDAKVEPEFLVSEVGLKNRAGAASAHGPRGCPDHVRLAWPQTTPRDRFVADSPLEGTKFENGPASRAMPMSTGDYKAGLNSRSLSGWNGPKSG